MSDNVTDSQLEQLRGRWAQDPTPHLALQLADVYRQRGQIDEALPVLERALQLHPAHVSIQVALGRYRLEAADPLGAASALRQVVDRDPGHLVANKLLVRAHLALGERQSAADRLELYALLNDSDPELEQLRSSLEAAAPVVGARETSPSLPEDFATAPAPPQTDLASLKPPATRRRVTGQVESEPFTELLDEPLLPGPMPDFFEQAEVESPAPQPVVTAEASSPSKPETSTDSHSAPEEVVPEEVGPEEVGPEEVGPEEVGPEEVETGSGATATLGALYMDQGYLDDARRTFESVLERDPEDAEALEGLEEVARRSKLEEAESAPGGGTKSAKILRLEQYLSRIRAAAERLSA